MQVIALYQIIQVEEEKQLQDYDFPAALEKDCKVFEIDYMPKVMLIGKVGFTDTFIVIVTGANPGILACFLWNSIPEFEVPEFRQLFVELAQMLVDVCQNYKVF